MIDYVADHCLCTYYVGALICTVLDLDLDGDSGLQNVLNKSFQKIIYATKAEFKISHSSLDVNISTIIVTLQY